MPSSPIPADPRAISCIPSLSAVRLEVERVQSDGFFCLAHPRRRRCSVNIESLRFSKAKDLLEIEPANLDVATLRSIITLLVCERHQDRWNKIYKIRVAKRWESEVECELDVYAMNWHADEDTLSRCTTPRSTPQRQVSTQSIPLTNDHRPVPWSVASDQSLHRAGGPPSPEASAALPSTHRSLPDIRVTDSLDENESPIIQRNRRRAPVSRDVDTSPSRRSNRGASPGELERALLRSMPPDDRVSARIEGNGTDDSSHTAASPPDNVQEEIQPANGRAPTIHGDPVETGPGLAHANDEDQVMEDVPSSGATTPGREDGFHRGDGYWRDPHRIDGDVKNLLGRKIEKYGAVYAFKHKSLGIFKIGKTTQSESARRREVVRTSGAEFDVNNGIWNDNIPVYLLDRCEELVHKDLAFCQVKLITRTDEGQTTGYEWFRADKQVVRDAMDFWESVVRQCAFPVKYHSGVDRAWLSTSNEAERRAANGDHMRRLQMWQKHIVLPHPWDASNQLKWLLGCTVVWLLPEILNIPPRLASVVVVLGLAVWTKYILAPFNKHL